MEAVGKFIAHLGSRFSLLELQELIVCFEIIVQ